MHMYTLKERERELKTKNQKKKELRTSERLRERTLPRCRDLSLDKVVRRRLKSILKSIDQSINRSIDKIENSVLPQCFSRSPPPSAVVSSRSGQPSRGLWWTLTCRNKKKINSLKNEGDTFASTPASKNRFRNIPTRNRATCASGFGVPPPPSPPPKLAKKKKFQKKFRTRPPPLPLLIGNRRERSEKISLSD